MEKKRFRIPISKHAIYMYSQVGTKENVFPFWKLKSSTNQLLFQTMQRQWVNLKMDTMV